MTDPQLEIILICLCKLLIDAETIVRTIKRFRRFWKVDREEKRHHNVEVCMTAVSNLKCPKFPALSYNFTP